MKKVLCLAAVMVFIASGLIVTKTEAAQKNPPNGSYRQTCRITSASNYGFQAMCERINGSWKKTTFTYGVPCRDIANIDGKLTCIR